MSKTNQQTNEMKNNLQALRIKNDVNGNPRIVVHFLNFLTKEECGTHSPEFNLTKKYELAHSPEFNLTKKYELAISRARKLGGKKFHNKRYGGGIVFQAYSVEEVREIVDRCLAEA